MWTWLRYRHLFKNLKSKHSEISKFAAQKLGETGNPKVAGALIAALDHPDYEVRKASAKSLGDLQACTAVRPLVASFSNGIARQAAEALIAIQSHEAVQPLIEFIESPDVNSYDKPIAVSVLVELRSSQAVPSLTKIMLSHQFDDDLRAICTLALGKIGDRRVVPTMIRILESPAFKASLRESVAIALGQLKDTRAVDALTRYLKNSRNAVAAEALGEIGDTKAVDAIINSSNWHNMECSLKAATALSKLKAPRAIKTILDIPRRFQEQSKTYNSELIVALTSLVVSTNADGQLLIDSLSDPVREVRHIAAGALQRLGWKGKTKHEQALFLAGLEQFEVLPRLGDTGVQLLISMLNDQDINYQVKAIQALGAGRVRRAVQPLISLLDKGWSRICEAAVKALEEIGDARANDALAALLLKTTGGYEQQQIKYAMSRLKTLPSLTDDAEKSNDAAGLHEPARPTGALGLDSIITQLNDPDEEVRELAVCTLGDLGGERAINALASLLTTCPVHNLGKVSCALAAALTKIGWKAPDDVSRVYLEIANLRFVECVKYGDTAIEPLAKILGELNAHPDPSKKFMPYQWKSRLEAAKSLGMLKDFRGLETVLELYRHDQAYRHDWDIIWIKAAEVWHLLLPKKPLHKLYEHPAVNRMIDELAKQSHGIYGTQKGLLDLLTRLPTIFTDAQLKRIHRLKDYKYSVVETSETDPEHKRNTEIKVQLFNLRSLANDILRKR